MIEIRRERPEDQAAVRQINDAAFEQGPEAALVDKLRGACDGYLAFVAVEDDMIVGQIVFTPVTIQAQSLCWSMRFNTRNTQCIPPFESHTPPSSPADL